jgi:hypothetical protein
MKEHDDVETKLHNIWHKIRKERLSNDREAILLLQCEAGWNLLDCMKVLAAKKQGVGVMILCRSLFERAATVDYLATSNEPNLIADYIDYGKIVAFEVAREMDTPQLLLNNLKAEYDKLKARFGKRTWHKGSVSSLVEKTEFNKVLQPGESGLYQGFYKETSSIAHGDSFILLHHRPITGWTLGLEPDEFHDWAIQGLSMGYIFMACMMASVSDGLDLPVESDFDELHPLLESLPSSAT